MSRKPKLERALAEISELLAAGTLTWVKLSPQGTRGYVPDLRSGERWFEGIGSGWCLILCTRGLRAKTAFASGVTWAGELIPFLNLPPEQVKAAIVQARRKSGIRPLPIRPPVKESPPDQSLPADLNSEDLDALGGLFVKKLQVDGAHSVKQTCKPDSAVSGMGEKERFAA